MLCYKAQFPMSTLIRPLCICVICCPQLVRQVYLSTMQLYHHDLNVYSFVWSSAEVIMTKHHQRNTSYTKYLVCFNSPDYPVSASSTPWRDTSALKLKHSLFHMFTLGPWNFLLSTRHSKWERSPEWCIGLILVTRWDDRWECPHYTII